MTKPKRQFATRVGTGTGSFLDGVDHRSAYARRFKELMASMVDDMGGDGAVGEAQKQLIRRAATLSLQAEILEAKAATGEGFDPDAFTKLTNTLNRVLSSLGLKKKAGTGAVQAGYAELLGD